MKKKIVIMMVLLLAVVGAKAQEVENPVGRFSVFLVLVYLWLTGAD